MDNLVKAICEKHHIMAESIQPMGGDQINQVFLVNNRFIIRTGQGDESSHRLQRETDLLRSLENEIPVPKLYALGQHETYTYQVQEYVRGKKLHQIWKDLSPRQKDRVIDELVMFMKILHQKNSPWFGYICHNDRRYQTWGEFCGAYFRLITADLENFKTKLPPDIIALALDYYQTYQQTLQGGTSCLVHGDLWMGNVLIDKGHIATILDFEFALYAPIDYELLLVEEFCLYPNDFAEKDGSTFSTADYADYGTLLRKHYPEMFVIPNTRERLNIYHLIYSLNGYLDWRKTQLIETSATLSSQKPASEMLASEPYPLYPTSRILNFVHKHGARIFV